VIGQGAGLRGRLPLLASSRDTRRRGEPRVPLRTCVGCRRPGEQGRLIRFGADAGGRLVVVARPARGRSAYLCPSLGCLAKALQRKAFPRALRRALGGVAWAVLEQAVVDEARRRGMPLEESRCR
jgi:predicted RNA-binding protein YlxR (DUF448 family)